MPSGFMPASVFRLVVQLILDYANVPKVTALHEVKESDYALVASS